MSIRYKKTHETAHVENARGRAIIAEGLAEHVSNQDYQLPKFGDAPGERPTWNVFEFEGAARRFLCIRMQISGRTEYYSAPPDQLTPRSFSWPCPEVVRKEYRDAWKCNPSLRDTMAEFGSRAQDAASDANAVQARLKQDADLALRRG